MNTITKFLIGICIALIVFVVVVFVLYFRDNPEKYLKKSKKKNSVDDEIEKELRHKK